MSRETNENLLSIGLTESEEDEMNIDNLFNAVASSILTRSAVNDGASTSGNSLVNQVEKPKKKRGGENNHSRQSNEKETEDPIQNRNNGDKRKLSDDQTPEGIVKLPQKRQIRDVDQTARSRINQSFRDALNTRRMAIIYKGYPNEFLGEKIISYIENFILKAIDALDSGAKGPSFKYRRVEEGYIKIACVGDHSVDFLKEVIERFKSDKKVVVVPFESLPKRPTFRVYLRQSNVTADLFISRVTKQNSSRGFNFASWNCQAIKSNGGGTCIIIEVSPDCAREIKKFDGYLHFGLSQIKLSEPKEKPNQIKMDNETNSSKIAKTGAGNSLAGLNAGTSAGTSLAGSSKLV